MSTARQQPPLASTETMPRWISLTSRSSVNLVTTNTLMKVPHSFPSPSSSPSPLSPLPFFFLPFSLLFPSPPSFLPHFPPTLLPPFSSSLSPRLLSPLSLLPSSFPSYFSLLPHPLPFLISSLPSFFLPFLHPSPTSPSLPKDTELWSYLWSRAAIHGVVAKEI